MQNPFETEERRAFRETIRRYVETEIKPNIDCLLYTSDAADEDCLVEISVVAGS